MSVPADGVRPTKDRVKGAIFSALDSRGLLVDAVVLDAFAGTGALGIEALSRGAASVTCIESDRAALVALRTNIATMKLTSDVVVVADSAERALARSPHTFDLVFLDPPYETSSAQLSEFICLVADKAPGGTIVVERPTRSEPITAPPGWSVVWERVFGDTLVVFVQPV